MYFLLFVPFVPPALIFIGVSFCVWPFGSVEAQLHTGFDLERVLDASIVENCVNSEEVDPSGDFGCQGKFCGCGMNMS